jgi:hypothetical protein
MGIIFSPTSSRYGPITVQVLRGEKPKATVITLFGGQTLRSAEGVVSKGADKLEPEEAEAIGYLLDHDWRIIQLSKQAVYYWGERWISDICTWARKKFGEPVTLFGHSAGAYVALGHIDKPFSWRYLGTAVNRLAIISIPWQTWTNAHLKMRFSEFDKFNVLFMSGSEDPAFETTRKMFEVARKSKGICIHRILWNTTHSVWKNPETVKLIDQFLEESLEE